MTPERLIIEKMFRIADKNGNDVPFLLNPAQAKIDDALTGRDIIPKARQEGVSSYFLARNTAKCLTQENRRCVVISHDTLSTQRMLAKVHYILEHLNPQAVIRNSSKNEIRFERTGSVFYIGTAGAQKFGRGDTITDLHCSEYAYWPDASELLRGLFQAVPKNGNISIESTGNGTGNDYHRRCMRAAEGLSRFRMHFLNWYEFPEYSYSVSDDVAAATMSNLREDWDEPALVKQFGLAAGQLLWRRDKLEELDYDLTSFKQEYPCTLDECFQASGHSVFPIVRYEATADWQRVEPGLHILKGHPNEHLTYIIGGDPSGGTGQDDAGAEVFCLETREQVAEYASNRVAPDVFAHKLVHLGRLFNTCRLSVESNNHGLVTLKVLQDIYPRDKLHRAFKSITRGMDESIMNLGVTTSARSRPLMIGTLRTALVNALTIHSPVLRDQLSTFIETESGKLAADSGCKDDLVIASALATIAMTRADILANRGDPLPKYRPGPFSLEAVLEEMHNRGDGLPIASQVIEDANSYTI